jgi:hypothetical protein
MDSSYADTRISRLRRTKFGGFVLLGTTYATNTYTMPW